ncbi:hypothetical protein J6590_101440 [Homalodisca vitripennis]|nr:hypothetical protein J6590_101440 [Homalodisca vitripennis]
MGSDLSAGAASTAADCGGISGLQRHLGRTGVKKRLDLRVVRAGRAAARLQILS